MAAPATRIGLLSRRDSADYLGLTVKTFMRHVEPKVPVIRAGARVLFDREDLAKWVEAQKLGNSSGNATTRTSVSRMRASATLSPSEQKMLERLQKPPRVSTPKLFPVGGKP